MDTNDYCENCSYCSHCYGCYNCYNCSYCYSCSNCYASSGLRMSENMLFCLGAGKYESGGDGYQKNNMIFNKQVTKDEFERVLCTMPTFDLQVTEGYQEAWKLWWDKASHEDKNKILQCGYFDAAIFKEIIGIDVTTTETIAIGGILYDKAEVEKRLKDIKPLNK